MFEVGFSELCLVGFIALTVIGPKKLPQVARVVGFWLGKARSMVTNLKEEARVQFQIEELQQLLVEQQNAKALQDLIDDTESALQPLNFAVQASPPVEHNRTDS